MALKAAPSKVPTEPVQPPEVQTTGFGVSAATGHGTPLPPAAIRQSNEARPEATGSLTTANPPVRRLAGGVPLPHHARHVADAEYEQEKQEDNHREFDAAGSFYVCYHVTHGILLSTNCRNEFVYGRGLW